MIQASCANEVQSYLHLIGISQQQLEELDSTEVLNELDPLLLKSLMRAPSFPVAKLHQWQIRNANWAELFGKIQQGTGKFYLAMGRVTRVMRIKLDDNLHQRYQMSDYYRVECKLAGEPATAAVIFCRKVPQSWLRDASSIELDEPFSSTTILLKVSSDDAPQPALWMVAHRIHWHPDHQQQPIPIPSDYLQLAQFHVDLGQFDDVRDKTPIGQRDRESFYQLLSAAQKSSTMQSTSTATKNRLLETLLVDPASQRGITYSFIGSARRAVKVIVDDEDILSRYGVDHYYDITVMIDPGRQIRVVQEAEDTAGKVFANNYPVTICVPQLPDGLPTGDFINEPLEITGWFLKLWTYQNEFMSGDVTTAGKRKPLQVSPLLIGYRIVHQPPTNLVDSVSDIIIGMVFVFSLLSLCGLVYWFHYSDQKFAKHRRKRT